jgi:NADP-dependent 3-hydroxy acid dehydrogenase YdfG
MSTSSDPEVVVITRARAGVGRATAQAFARRGARVGLLTRGREKLEIAGQEVEAQGGQALVLPTDVAAAAAIEETFGPIDIWINNAMVTVFSPTKELQPAEARRVTEVNYLGYVYGTLAALKRMLPRDQGVIVQVGSALAYRSIPLQSAYCGSKAAIRGFTDSLRSELIHDHSRVRLTMVQLPALNTPSSPGVRRVSRASPSRCRRSISRRLPPRPSSGHLSTTGVSSSSVGRQCRRSGARSSSRTSSTATWRERPMMDSNTMARQAQTVAPTFGSRCPETSGRMVSLMTAPR